MRFRNREEAGEQLAAKLQNFKGQAVVFALPRGGVALGAAIAKELDAPLDLIIPRKVGHPWEPEFGVCAVTESGGLVCNQSVARHLNQTWLRQEIARERAEARRRRLKYQRDRKRASAAGKVAIITDDGIATGLTMKAAIEEAKKQRPAQVIVAVPVVPADTARQLRELGAEVVALDITETFLGSVGAYYLDFDQVEDAEVLALLDSATKTGSSR